MKPEHIPLSSQPAPSIGSHDTSRESAGFRIPASLSVGEMEAVAPETVQTPSATPLPTTMENVPGYTPRGLAERASLGIIENGSGVPLASGSRSAVVDAALPAFNKIDQLEVVIGDDDRQRVPEVQTSPWRRICALRITAATGKVYVGTAWFIGPRTLITAGHCVYIHEQGGWARSIEVIPALDGMERPYGQAVTSKLEAPQGWIVNRNSDFDYGAIFLDEDLGNQVGWFAFASLSEIELQQAVVNISGYPADLERATRQYYHARQITRSSERRLYYEIDTFGGQSGSPIWLTVEGKRVAVGIHTNGASSGNFGTRIIPEVFENLKRWKQLGNGGN